jgi:NADPH:quinone reductase-like Zn-dependent oxidoreductase
MKAIVFQNYGSPDVLKVEELKTPSPGDDEVLLRVRAAALNPLDWRVMRGKPFLVRLMVGLRKPRDTRPGRDVAGQVEAVGRNVTQLKPGDEVFGVCRGALAEYACAAESALVVKSDKVTFEQAAAVPVAAYTALQGLRDQGRIQPGQKVLVNGAAGGVGTFAVQIAKSFGAEVTGVCSTRNVELVSSIGADRVVDYTREDFTTSGQRYDLILDCVGNHSLLALRRVLNPRGRYVGVGASTESMIGILARMAAAPLLSRLVSQSFVLLMAKSSKEDLAFLGGLMEAGKVTPVIDRSYRLSEVPEAFRYLEGGHARGKVVIALDESGKQSGLPLRGDPLDQ